MQTTINGKAFEVGPEPADYWGWIREGRYNYEWAVYDAHLKPEHTFIDLGAWVGAHSLYASLIACRVFAIEPDPVAFPIAQKNLKGFGVHSFAVSDHTGEIKLGSGWLGASTTRTNPNAGSGIGAWDDTQTCVVSCTTLRNLCRDIQGPLFIKCDIEGSEEAVLKDLAFFAERKPTLYIELHPFWWKDEAQTWKDFEAVKALYKNAREVVGKTWLLND